jgi:hypothetical protein
MFVDLLLYIQEILETMVTVLYSFHSVFNIQSTFPDPRSLAFKPLAVVTGIHFTELHSLPNIYGSRQIYMDLDELKISIVRSVTNVL